MHWSHFKNIPIHRQGYKLVSMYHIVVQFQEQIDGDVVFASKDGCKIDVHPHFTDCVELIIRLQPG